MSNLDPKLNSWLKTITDEASTQLADAAVSARRDFDDGSYVGLVTKHAFKMSKNDNPGISTALLILESVNESYVGETYGEWQSLDRENGFKYFGWRLANFEIDISDPVDVVKELKSNAEDVYDLVRNCVVVKFKLETTKSDNKEYQNLKIVKVLHDYDLSPFEGLIKGSASGAAKGTNTQTPTEPEDDGLARVGMTIKFIYRYERRGRPVEEELIGVITEIKTDSVMVEVDEAGSKEVYEVLGADVLEIVTEAPLP